MKKSFQWLVIDLDHILTRHYTGLKNHLQNTEPEKYHQGYQWEDDTTFLGELRNHVQNKIKHIVSINRVNPKRVILIADDIRSETTDWIWRTSLWSNWSLKFKSDYYTCRMGTIRNRLLTQGLKNFFKKESYTYFSYLDFEADDVIAIVIRSISDRYHNDKLSIVTHDSDFYQLISDKVNILNLDGLQETSKYYSTSKENLWFSIIGGKMSNLVPGLKFKKDLLKEFMLDNYDSSQDLEDEADYRRVTREEQHHLVSNLDRTIKWITETRGLIENDQHIINQKVLDFNEIPLRYVQSISSTFWKKYNKDEDDKLQPIVTNKIVETDKKTKKFSSNLYATLTVE